MTIFLPKNSHYLKTDAYIFIVEISD